MVDPTILNSKISLCQSLLFQKFDGALLRILQVAPPCSRGASRPSQVTVVKLHLELANVGLSLLVLGLSAIDGFGGGRCGVCVGHLEETMLLLERTVLFEKYVV